MWRLSFCKDDQSGKMQKKIIQCYLKVEAGSLDNSFGIITLSVKFLNGFVDLQSGNVKNLSSYYIKSNGIHLELQFKR